jgi:hypothetical protein
MTNTDHHSTHTFYQARPTISSSFSELIVNKWRRGSFEAFHLTTTYKPLSSGSTDLRKAAETATDALSKSVPRILSKLLSPNWARDRYRRAFQLFSFLDVPGSRSGIRPVFEITSSQDEFHHHSVLLVKPWLAERLFVRLNSTSIGTCTSRFDGYGYNLDLRKHSPIKTCYLQHLESEDDVAACSAYATKVLDGGLRAYPDDAYQFFPRT